MCLLIYKALILGNRNLILCAASRIKISYMKKTGLCSGFFMF